VLPQGKERHNNLDKHDRINQAPEPNPQTKQKAQNGFRADGARKIRQVALDRKSSFRDDL
jgi:hypothetical protein